MSDETSGHRQTVNILQACALAGVSRRTIYNWLTKGHLEFVRTAGGSVRIYSDTLFRPGKKSFDAHTEYLRTRQPETHGA